VTRLLDGYEKNRISILDRDKDFSLLLACPAGGHAASYQRPNWGSFPEGKLSGEWSWPLTSIKCLGYACAELYFHSPYVFLTIKYKDNFKLYSRSKKRHYVVSPVHLGSSGRSLWLSTGNNFFQIFVHHPFLSFFSSFFHLDVNCISTRKLLRCKNDITHNYSQITQRVLLLCVFSVRVCEVKEVGIAQSI
jgi:hypothetical protein